MNKTQKFNAIKKGVNFVEEKKKYDPASIELIYFDSQDVITTSANNAPPLGNGDGSGSWDDNGWT